MASHAENELLVGGLSMGRIVIFLYPAPDERGCFTELERHRVVVRSVAWGEEQPINPAAPLVRGAISILGTDLDRGGTRRFWVAGMREVEVCSADEHWGVFWVDTPRDWFPGSPVPAGLRIGPSLLSEVAHPVALVVADAGNAFRYKAGDSGRWLMALEMTVVETE